jgi:hypothetical protein
LTLDGKEPTDLSKDGLKPADYVKLSFKDDVHGWLEGCANTPETTIPVRENLKQLIAAVKSLCGKSEDANMDKEISKLITESEDTFRAALAINRLAKKLDYERWELFKGPIFNAVHAALSDSDVNEDEGWHAILVWIKNSKYVFCLNYDWNSAVISREDDKPDSAEEKRIADRMSEITGVKTPADGTAVWLNGKTKIYYPGLEDADEDLYPYQLYKQYSEHPQEVADRIISIARELEAVEGCR